MRSFSALVFGLLLSLPGATSYASELIECKFSERLSLDYEEINDFSFQDYPSLLVKSVPGGWEVAVGAITYGDEYSGTAPEQIRRKDIGSKEIRFENTNLDERWLIRMDLQKKVASFSADLDGRPANLIDIALFTCK